MRPTLPRLHDERKYATQNTEQRTLDSVPPHTALVVVGGVRPMVGEGQRSATENLRLRGHEAAENPHIDALSSAHLSYFPQKQTAHTPLVLRQQAHDATAA